MIVCLQELVELVHRGNQSVWLKIMDLFSSTIGLMLEWDLKSLLLFLSVFIITADYIKNRRPLSFPPGPPGLPILGNIFTVDVGRPHESFSKVPIIKKKRSFVWQFIFSVNVGWKCSVVGSRIWRSVQPAVWSAVDCGVEWTQSFERSSGNKGGQCCRPPTPPSAGWDR